MQPAWMDRVILKGMVFYSHVGVLPHEKEKGQDFELDVVFYCHTIQAAKTDEIGQTIDYGQAYRLIKKIVEEATCDLIEKLADLVADMLLQTFLLAAAVTVTVKKPHAPIDGQFEYMGVSITRERS